MTKERKEAEALIYKFFDAMDSSKENSSYYKYKFSKMNDEEFKKYISKPFPYKFQTRPFDIEPTMDDINNGLKVLGVPLLEKVNLNYLHKNENGVAIKSPLCLVGPVPLKKMKQFLSKKNAMSTNISERDKSGLLVNFDKNGIQSDREIEALAINGLDNTIKELTRPRADSMEAKSEMYSIINTKGSVSLSELDIAIDDSLSKNLISVYLLGSHLYTNMVNEDYMLPNTIKNKSNKVERK